MTDLSRDVKAQSADPIKPPIPPILPIRPLNYNPLKWYWIIDDSETQVWSSAVGKLISTTDTDYQSWAEHHVTPKGSWSGLYDLMMPIAPDKAASIAHDHGDTLTPTQQVGALTLAGLTVTSTTTPNIDGTYPLDVNAISRINSISTYIMVNQTFPAGLSEFPMIDSTNKMHMFPSTAVFLAWATAIADYVTKLELFFMTGTGNLPPSAVALDV